MASRRAGTAEPVPPNGTYVSVIRSLVEHGGSQIVLQTEVALPTSGSAGGVFLGVIDEVFKVLRTVLPDHQDIGVLSNI